MLVTWEWIRLQWGFWKRRVLGQEILPISPFALWEWIYKNTRLWWWYINAWCAQPNLLVLRRNRKIFCRRHRKSVYFVRIYSRNGQRAMRRWELLSPHGGILLYGRSCVSRQINSHRLTWIQKCIALCIPAMDNISTTIDCPMSVNADGTLCLNITYAQTCEQGVFPNGHILGNERIYLKTKLTPLEKRCQLL